MHGSVIPQLKKPGRRPANKLPYRKKELSPDAKIIIALLKKQPQTRDELIKNAPVSTSVFYENSALLKEKGYITENEKGYALWTCEDAEGTVVKAINKWRQVAFRDPDVIEIANETSISPQDVESLRAKIKDKIGWKMPNEAIKQSAANMLGEVLWCAAQIKEKISDSDYKNDPEIFEQAERFLKEHPEMVPKFQILYDDLQNMKEPGFRDISLSYTPKDISWPSETLRCMGDKTPKLKTRVIPSGVSICVYPTKNNAQQRS